MANWETLRARLASVEDQLSLPWAELDDVVGGLPPSARKFPTFWGGSRPQWRGFRTTDVRLGERVTFVRRTEGAQAPAPAPAAARDREVGQAGLVLIGCVKSKWHHATQAKDLYTSALFRKERDYAESSGKPWFILSAKHGLVSPDEVIEPYDVYLKKMPAAYRAWWGATVVEQLTEKFGPVQGVTIEIHASAAYVDQIRSKLEADGARVIVPLDGLTMGQRLAWYGGPDTAESDGDGDAIALSGGIPSSPSDLDVVGQLRRREAALSPQEFIATGGMGLRHPGLYSWWVDPVGAATLTAGLGHRIEPGLIYAGLAGATHTRSGKESGNTLWGRIRSMHLGGRHEFSTFRRSLGSILASALLAPGIDEAALTAWMFEHLRVVAVPVADADTLDALETTVLTELDPPLNLMKMPKTPVRMRLSELRHQYAGPDGSVRR
jgi:hypothetical protein